MNGQFCSNGMLPPIHYVVINMLNTFWAKENDSGACCGREQACEQSPDS